MKLASLIAGKYLVGKKSSQAIHWITGISVVGIAIGSGALILVLSVFNGFETLLSGMFSKHNPDIKIVTKIGKTFQLDSQKIQQIKSWSEVEAVSLNLEEVVMFQYAGTQEFGKLLGVSLAFAEVSRIDEATLEGSFDLFKNEKPLANIGLGLRNKLGISLEDYMYSLKIFVPEESDLSSSTLYQQYQLTPQSVFRFNNEADYNTVIAPIESVQRFLKKENKLSSIELKLNKNASSSKVSNKLQDVFGDSFHVKDRYKQDEAFIKIMKLEKWLFFALFSLTMILVSFTVVGALYMIVLDKRQDISILKSMGMDDINIRAIFTILGFMICGLGLSIGFFLATVFFLLQRKYGLIGVPDEFIIDSYPIEMHYLDFFIVSITVLIIGWMATLIPAKKINEIKPIFRED